MAVEINETIDPESELQEAMSLFKQIIGALGYKTLEKRFSKGKVIC